MKQNEFEDIFKNSFENFEEEVSPSVWKNVQTALKGAGIGLIGKAILNKIGTNTLVAIVSSAAAVVSTVLVLNWNTAPATKPAPKNPAPKTNADIPKAKVEEIKAFLSNNAADNKPKAPAKQELQNNADNSDPAKTAVKDTKIKKDQMAEVINEYSDETVASISASPVGGAVPLVVNLTNTGSGKVNRWSFGDGNRESGANPVHVYDVPGVYTIKLTSLAADGRTSVDSIKVEVTGNSSIPKLPIEFSPNGDNIQDTFSFKAYYMVSMEVTVFDKKGTILYKSGSLDAHWDGLDLKGKKVKEGTYYYILAAKGTDGKKYDRSGIIRLTR